MKTIKKKEILKINPDINFDDLKEGKILIQCKCGNIYIDDYSDESECPKCNFVAFIDFVDYKIIK